VILPYPSQLPEPSVSFFGSAETSVLRTSGDNGLAVQEPRFSTNLTTYGVEWIVTQLELAFFEQWFGDTLLGGVLVFSLDIPEGGSVVPTAVRFVGGDYRVGHREAQWFTLSARVEKLGLNPAFLNRTPVVPSWRRLRVDPAEAQKLTLAYRNALLVVRPDDGSQTALRIPPPLNPSSYVYFGVDNQGEGETLITSEGEPPITGSGSVSFPAGLPGVTSDFQLVASREAARVEMDSGHPRQYANADTASKLYRVAWEFTVAQLHEFQVFFFQTLEGSSRSFFLRLPVDGLFAEVQVRFLDGEFGFNYLPDGTFKVVAILERVVNQTVAPPAHRPFPLYYAPSVEVTQNTKVSANDAMKFFIVNAPQGETVNLHIYQNMIEFGVLSVGLGNVLITRGPFLLNLGNLGPEEANSSFNKPFVGLLDTIVSLGEVGNEEAESLFLKPFVGLLDTIVPLGNVAQFGEEIAESSFREPYSELKRVLLPIGDVTDDDDNATSEFKKPHVTLEIP
jgi:hypothetical protein